MIRALAILLLLLTCLAGAAADSSVDASPGNWRQTRDGWERYEDVVRPPLEYRRPALHPAVVGALEALLTVTAMLALAEDRERAA